MSLVVFVFLLGFGVNNVQVSSAKDNEKVLGVINELPSLSPSPIMTSSPTPIASVSATFRPRVLQVASDSAITKTTTTKTNKTLLTITITDGSASVNIRKTPSTVGEKIGTAKEGQVFEYVDYDPIGWYKIVLKDGMGYVSTKYIKLGSNTN